MAQMAPISAEVIRLPMQTQSPVSQGNSRKSAMEAQRPLPPILARRIHLLLDAALLVWAVGHLLSYLAPR